MSKHFVAQSSRKNVQVPLSPIFEKTKLASIFSPIFSREMWKKQFQPFKAGSVQNKISYFFPSFSPLLLLFLPLLSCFFPFFLLGIIFPLVTDTRTKVRHVVVTILHPLKILHVEESATRHELTDWHRYWLRLFCHFIKLHSQSSESATSFSIYYCVGNRQVWK